MATPLETIRCRSEHVRPINPGVGYVNSLLRKGGAKIGLYCDGFGNRRGLDRPAEEGNKVAYQATAACSGCSFVEGLIFRALIRDVCTARQLCRAFPCKVCDRHCGLGGA